MAGPQKSSVPQDGPRWPVSPRLRSPPPLLHKPIPSHTTRAKTDQEPPEINVQRATPSPHPEHTGTPTESESEEPHAPAAGTRTPGRGAGGSTSTLETVQESPRAGLDSALEKLRDGLIGKLTHGDGSSEDMTSAAAKLRANISANESGSESGSTNARRSSSVAQPPMMSRQSSSSARPAPTSKAKPASEGSHMTVETETVTSIPQVVLAPSNVSMGTTGSGTLRRKQSAETIRPKKEKKKTSRSVAAGTGEDYISTSSLMSSSTTLDALFCQGQHAAKGSSSTDNAPTTAGRRQSSAKLARQKSQGFHLSTSPRHLPAVNIYNTTPVLTRTRPASTKSDIFEAKVASAVDEANTSDSEETFVYDSNPRDHAHDRPRRFHSRTPSTTSMTSQGADRGPGGMRSINSVMESAGAVGPVPSSATAPPKKGMKFVSTFGGGSSNGGDSAGGGAADDHLDGSRGGTTRRGSANVVDGSSTRGTTPRHHHHAVGRYGARGGGGNGHASILDDGAFAGGNGNLSDRRSRQSSRPTSPRGLPYGTSGRNGSKRDVRQLGGGYDLDDTGTGGDDERMPLLFGAGQGNGTMRSSGGRVTGRLRRAGLHFRRSRPSDMGRGYPGSGRHGRPPSWISRFAGCLVLLLMIVLVVSGAIGFMFVMSQPLTDLELVGIKNVLASEQELMLDLTVRAHNPNVVVVLIDSADLEVFAKSPHAGTDDPHDHPKKGRPKDGDDGTGTFTARRRLRYPGTGVQRGEGDNGTSVDDGTQTDEDDGLNPPDFDPAPQPPVDDTSPNMRLGTIYEFDSPLSFEGSWFRSGGGDGGNGTVKLSQSTGSVRLKKPGNGTEGGTERWERIIQDEFELILKGVLKYSLPLSQRVRSVSISGRTKVKPNSVDDPSLKPNETIARFGA